MVRIWQHEAVIRLTLWEPPLGRSCSSSTHEDLRLVSYSHLAIHVCDCNITLRLEGKSQHVAGRNRAAQRGQPQQYQQPLLMRVASSEGMRRTEGRFFWTMSTYPRKSRERSSAPHPVARGRALPVRDTCSKVVLLTTLTFLSLSGQQICGTARQQSTPTASHIPGGSASIHVATALETL